MNKNVRHVMAVVCALLLGGGIELAWSDTQLRTVTSAKAQSASLQLKKKVDVTLTRKQQKRIAKLLGKSRWRKVSAVDRDSMKQIVALIETLKGKLENQTGSGSRIVVTQSSGMITGRLQQQSDKIETAGSLTKDAVTVAVTAQQFGTKVTVAEVVIAGSTMEGLAAANGVVTSLVLGYQGGKAFMENTESGKTAGKYWGELLADSQLGKKLAAFLFGIASEEEGAQGDPDAGDPQTTPGQTNGGGNESGNDEESSSNEEDDDDSDDSDDSDSDENQQSTEEQSDDEDQSSDEDSSNDEGTGGSTDNPRNGVDVPPELINKFLKSPAGQETVKLFKKAIASAVNGGLLPPEGPYTRRDLAIILANNPKLVRLLMSVEIKLLKDAIIAATGGHEKEPAPGDENKLTKTVIAGTIAIHLIPGYGLVDPVDKNIQLQGVLKN